MLSLRRKSKQQRKFGFANFTTSEKRFLNYLHSSENCPPSECAALYHIRDELDPKPRFEIDPIRINIFCIAHHLFSNSQVNMFLRFLGNFDCYFIIPILRVMSKYTQFHVWLVSAYILLSQPVHNIFLFLQRNTWFLYLRWDVCCGKNRYKTWAFLNSQEKLYLIRSNFVSNRYSLENDEIKWLCILCKIWGDCNDLLICMSLFWPQRFKDCRALMKLKWIWFDRNFI